MSAHKNINVRVTFFNAPIGRVKLDAVLLEVERERLDMDWAEFGRATAAIATVAAAGILIVGLEHLVGDSRHGRGRTPTQPLALGGRDERRVESRVQL